MLSLKNSASGTNLTEATHIFFVEPIDAAKEKCRAIEGQAIARACRVGQKNKIIVNRILVEDSIEEIIYRKSYDKDVVVEIDN
jgi:SNF2 family DNA or RNA helicase